MAAVSKLSSPNTLTMAGAGKSNAMVAARPIFCVGFAEPG